MPGFDDRIEELCVGLMKPDVDLLKLAKIVTLTAGVNLLTFLRTKIL